MKMEKIFVYLMLLGFLVGVSATEVSANGTETLGVPDINIAAGSGFVANGVGLETQPGTVDINVPDGATIKQVLLYWEGQHTTASGDNTILVDGTTITGELIGGPTLFFANVKSSSFRADITGFALANGVIKPGANTVTLSGLTFDNKNDGAGIVVIFEKGPLTDLQLLDGNDNAFFQFTSPLDTTVPQTFKFDPVSVDRKADLSLFVSSVTPDVLRPSEIDVSVSDGAVTLDTFVDQLNSNNGKEWDTFSTQVNIPAGANQLTVQVLSKSDGSTALPASLTWSTVVFSVPKEEKVAPGRMTGGGSVFKGDLRVTHGFELHCDKSKPNNLEVNFAGNRFHLKELTSATCTDDPKIVPKPPVAPFDTFTGKGTGKFNGVDGAKIEFVFTDAGEPGKDDTAAIKIFDKDGKVVLDVSGFLKVGNHQAHAS